MKVQAILSSLLHLLVFIVLMMDWGDSFRTKLKESPPLLIDFEAVGAKSTAPRLAPSQEKKADVAKKPDAQEKPKQTDMSPPTDAQNTTQKQPEPQPVEQAIEKPVEKKEEKPKTKDAAHLEKIKEKPKPKAKTKKPDKAPKKQPVNDSQLVNLQKKKKSDKTKKEDKKAKSIDKALDDFMDNLMDQDGVSEPGAPAETIGEVLTATEIQAVVATLKKCWYVPAGTQGVFDTVVDVTLHLKPDGTVVRVEIEDMKRYAKDPVFRTAAESVERAALDPKCNPLPLPKNKYEHWKTLALEFNPKLMAGISGGIR